MTYGTDQAGSAVYVSSNLEIHEKYMEIHRTVPKS